MHLAVVGYFHLCGTGVVALHRHIEEYDSEGIIVEASYLERGVYDLGMVFYSNLVDTKKEGDYSSTRLFSHPHFISIVYSFGTTGDSMSLGILMLSTPFSIEASILSFRISSGSKRACS